MYIADTSAHVIRKVSVATGARLNTPAEIALHGAGDMYITDAGNSVIRKIDSGNITTVAGLGLLTPKSVAVDAAGNLYSADLRQS